jgi:hypothetical protein
MTMVNGKKEWISVPEIYIGLEIEMRNELIF